VKDISRRSSIIT